MPDILLIRHARYQGMGQRLAGRTPGLPLDDVGRAQAQALAARLAGVPLAAVYTSPIERARETAEVLAAERALSVQVDEELTEFDFGDWTGRAVDDLVNAGDPAWRTFNRSRSSTAAPNGEHPAACQARMVAALERIAGRHPRSSVAVVSHADPIRSAIAHYLGMPLDHLLRLEIEPAMLAILQLEPWGGRLLGLNREHLHPSG